ncbi:endonuclease/exonuclease/phosphatase family protein [Streptomyces sp. NPDC001212]
MELQPQAAGRRVHLPRQEALRDRQPLRLQARRPGCRQPLPGAHPQLRGVQRTQQAAVENAFIKELLAADPKANLVVLGDLNDFQFSPAVQTLTGNGKQLTDLVNTLPQAERYSYVYQDNSQVLDHILVNPAMKHVSYDVVHINSVFADQTSDHEPQVVRVKP